MKRLQSIALLSVGILIGSFLPSAMLKASSQNTQDLVGVSTTSGAAATANDAVWASSTFVVTEGGERLLVTAIADTLSPLNFTVITNPAPETSAPYRRETRWGTLEVTSSQSWKTFDPKGPESMLTVAWVE